MSVYQLRDCLRLDARWMMCKDNVLLFMNIPDLLVQLVSSKMQILRALEGGDRKVVREEGVSLEECIFGTCIHALYILGSIQGNRIHSAER